MSDNKKIKFNHIFTNITSAEQKWKQEEKQRFYSVIRFSRQQVINFLKNDLKGFNEQFVAETLKKVKADKSKHLLLWFKLEEVATGEDTKKRTEKTETK